MSTLAHMVSGAYLGVLAANVAPSETSYILVALASGAVLDLDHLYYFIKDWKFYKKNGFVGHMYKARSVLHELFGFFVIGAVMLAVSFFNIKLALVIGIPWMVHATEDIIMGRSQPFSPFDNTSIVLVSQKKRVKIIVDIIVLIIFSGLWIQYLNAA